MSTFTCGCTMDDFGKVVPCPMHRAQLNTDPAYHPFPLPPQMKEDALDRIATALERIEAKMPDRRERFVMAALAGCMADTNQSRETETAIAVANATLAAMEKSP